MSKFQVIKEKLQPLFQMKTAVMLWIIHTILYGVCLYFCYIKINYTMADIFGGLSWIICMVAYISSAGVIIKALINKQLLTKQKVYVVLSIVGVYLLSSGILYLIFNDSVEETQKMLESEEFKTELEADDWSDWSRE